MVSCESDERFYAIFCTKYKKTNESNKQIMMSTSHEKLGQISELGQDNVADKSLIKKQKTFNGLINTSARF